ncbi:4035_t:CDS:1 [Acaulospora colombiana]|uniref:4035_t:CDS:1 n=1 Tax=Acaulospora colombiana TaxID=27376 RepID=A0ACA9MWR1_9GLOM|nr:4035_t:CDS:1 [Acaulospora colombiana]
MLRSRRTKLTVIICLLVTLGLALTNFDSLIVVNTIGYINTCKTDVVRTNALITNEKFQVAVASYADTEALLQKRNESGVPSGVLVGQLPQDPGWVFDSEFDVDPYPWRSSCSIYASGEVQVNMNTSVLFDTTYQNSNLQQMLPEVNSKYGFENSTDGYNYTKKSFKSYAHFVSNSDKTGYMATGCLILIIEEFTKGNVSLVGSSVINRLWTLRVPQNNRIPYNLNNQSKFEIVSLPTVVKAYSCEITRVSEGSRGGVNVLGDISVAISTAGDLIGRKFLDAQIKGTNDTIMEYSPEYWASYIEVRDTMTANISEVTARISQPCFSVSIIYIILICAYIILIIVGFFFWIRFQRDKVAIPGSVVSWAVLACKEPNLIKEGDESDGEIIKGAEFRGYPKNVEYLQFSG